MVGICPQDHYSSQEDLIRILKIGNEALVRQEGLVRHDELNGQDENYSWRR